MRIKIIEAQNLMVFRILCVCVWRTSLTALRLVLQFLLIHVFGCIKAFVKGDEKISDFCFSFSCIINVSMSLFSAFFLPLGLYLSSCLLSSCFLFSMFGYISSCNKFCCSKWNSKVYVRLDSYPTQILRGK